MDGCMYVWLYALALCFGIFQPSRTWDLGMLGCMFGFMFDFLLPMFTDLDCGLLGFFQSIFYLFGCC
jgi:hypothetical protein